MIDLAKAIRIARAAAGLSQADIAKQVQNHESAVSRWESGTRTPSVDQVDIIAKALGIPFDLLVSLGRENHVVTTEEAQQFLQWLNDLDKVKPCSQP